MATDEAFALKVATMQTEESLVKLAKNEGITISEEQAKAGLEKINSLAQDGKTLNDDEVDEVGKSQKAKFKSKLSQSKLLCQI